MMNYYKGETMTDEQLMQLAQRRVKIKSRFLVSLIAYIPFNAFIILIWLSTSKGSFWPKWVLLGTGLLLLVHGIAVLLELNNVTEQGKVEAEYKRLKQAAQEQEPNKN
jgi:hypothetical protein